MRGVRLDGAGGDDFTPESRALEFDLRFHDVPARAAGNERLRADISRYRLLARAFCRLTGSPENLEEALREHVEVLRALEAGSAEEAARAMAGHVEARLRVVIERLCPENR
jgi:DNA-binding GntR family transcriptional regulator